MSEAQGRQKLLLKPVDPNVVFDPLRKTQQRRETRESNVGGDVSPPPPPPQSEGRRASCRDKRGRQKSFGRELPSLEELIAPWVPVSTLTTTAIDQRGRSSKHSSRQPSAVSNELALTSLPVESESKLFPPGSPTPSPLGIPTGQLKTFLPNVNEPTGGVGGGGCAEEDLINRQAIELRTSARGFDGWKANFRALHKSFQTAANVASRYLRDPEGGGVLAAPGDSSSLAAAALASYRGETNPTDSEANGLSNLEDDEGEENSVPMSGETEETYLIVPSYENVRTPPRLTSPSLSDETLEDSQGLGRLVLPGNEVANLVLQRCACLCVGLSTPVVGRLVCTNYRLLFLPSHRAPPGMEWLMRLQVLEVALGQVEDVQVAQGKERGLEPLGVKILTKDNRQLSFYIDEDCRRRQVLDSLTACLFPRTLEDLFAFYPLKPSTCNPQEAKIDFGWNMYQPLAEYRRMGVLLNCVNQEQGDDRPSDDSLFSPCPARLISSDGGYDCAPQGLHVPYTLRLTNSNLYYEVCPSYPSYLVVPSFITDGDIRKLAEFRAKGRFPVLCWANRNNSATLWRCSQPKSAFFRCREDEIYLSSLAIPPSSSTKPVLILDLRPMMNAFANKATGAGYEDVVHYPNCQLEFANIDNIHRVRDSWYKMCTAVKEFFDKSLTHSHGSHLPPGSQILPSSLWPAVASSLWYDHISRILRAVNRVVHQLQKGLPVVVHCSDGWDRTAQVTSLAMLAMDPYYRTGAGFVTLIEKEFLHFGHRFHSRCGHPAGRRGAFRGENGPGAGGGSSHDSTQRCPIFLQWLECVYQFLIQFPLEFEFSASFLQIITEHLYSCKFGTFLCDTQKEREENGLARRTSSLWSSLFIASIRCEDEEDGCALSNRNDSLHRNYKLKAPWLNGLYALRPRPTGVIRVQTTPFDLSIWAGLWLRYHPLGERFVGGEPSAHGQISTAVSANQELLRKEIKKLKDEISALKQQVKGAQVDDNEAG